MSGPRLSIIPAGAIFDRTLEPRDLQVLNLLGCHTDKAGWCRRSQVRMAAELDCSRSSVQRSLDRLVEAGWVQKKRVPWAAQEGQPSGSYMYRVMLDRDDEPAQAPENDEADAETETEGHAENAEDMASEDAQGCPRVGTPAHIDGHPGAQPYVGTGAHTYVGTKNDPLERPPLERERDARAREAKDKSARFIVAFEQRWPTAAVDDRQRTAYAAESLSEEERAAALAGIGPFLDSLKRAHRRTVPAGWKYLEEKRWTLLERAPTAAQPSAAYAADSLEAKAVRALHEIAGRAAAFWKIWHRPDGSVSFARPITDQLRALAQMPDRDAWVTLDRNGGAAWERLMREVFPDEAVRTRFAEGTRAPWPFPPSHEGKIYPATTGPPPDLCPITEEELADFR